VICFGGSHMSIAKGIDAHSCKEFENHQIIFRAVFDTATLHKAKYDKTFAKTSVVQT
jgi:hypothetical protein